MAAIKPLRNLYGCNCPQLWQQTVNITQLCRAELVRQAPRKLASKRWENKGARAGVARHEGLARTDVGWCHEIQPCEDIGRQAARRNANAAARKTSPGIAALACAYCSTKRASASCAPCSWPDAASISRLANMVPAPAHTSPPSKGGTTAGWPYPPPSKICIGQRLSHGARRLAFGGLDWDASPQPAISHSRPRAPELP
jgi:hypothetical protein